MLHSLQNNVVNLGISHDFDDFFNFGEIWLDKLVDVCGYSRNVLKEFNLYITKHDYFMLVLLKIIFETALCVDYCIQYAKDIRKS